MALAELLGNGLQVQNPTRSFGYFVGDTLEQKINLDSGNLIDPELPSEQRVNEFLYRLATKVEIVNKQRWLHIRYQIINSPNQTTTINLPGHTFKSKSDEEVVLPPWNFNVAALTTTDNVTDENDGGLSPLDDIAGLTLVEKRDNKGLKLSFAALLLTILLWLTWWIARHFRDLHTLPFAKAHRIIKKLPADERDTNSDSWVALHHAFNEVAGKTISAGNTDKLYAAAPWLESENNSIEHFYKVSSGRFFKGSNTTEEVPVNALSRTLYQLEKRQAKRQVNKPTKKAKSKRENHNIKARVKA